MYSGILCVVLEVFVLKEFYFRIIMVGYHLHMYVHMCIRFMSTIGTVSYSTNFSIHTAQLCIHSTQTDGEIYLDNLVCL